MNISYVFVVFFFFLSPPISLCETSAPIYVENYIKWRQFQDLTECETEDYEMLHSPEGLSLII